MMAMKAQALGLIGTVRGTGVARTHCKIGWTGSDALSVINIPWRINIGDK